MNTSSIRLLRHRFVIAALLAGLFGATVNAQERGKRLLVLSAVLFFTSIGLIGCKPTKYLPNESPTLYTTISSDGQMVAALDRIGTDKPRLRVKRLEPEGPWQDMPVPPFTTSIRFGLKGKELLFTAAVGEAEKTVLASWDMDKPEAGPKTLYEGYGLVFPIETSKGEYLVRSCVPTSEGHCHRAVGVWWDWVREGKRVHLFRSNEAMNYSQPNVVQGQGFYWMKVRGELKEIETFPSFRSFAFPGKTAPQFSQTFDPNTEDLWCDYKTDRCLRSFIKNFTGFLHNDPKSIPLSEGGRPIFGVGAMYGGQVCNLSGIGGYYDKVSISPNGHAAVMSLAPKSDEPRHVVVMQFKQGQCEPTSIQHFYFEEK